MKEGKQLRMCLPCRNKKNKWYKQMKKHAKIHQTNLSSSARFVDSDTESVENNVIKSIKDRFVDSDSESVENQFHLYSNSILTENIAEADSNGQSILTPPSYREEEVESNLDVDLLFSEIINWSRDFR
jgi:hypothetical protein